MSECIVLGAGMVGIGTALALQRHGRRVIVVDRRAPGQEASYGNAGLIQAEAVEPYGFPLDAASILSILTRRTNDVDWTWSALPALLPAVLRYAYHSLPGPYARIVPAFARLIARATSDHGALLAAAGAEDLIARNGYFAAYESGKTMDEAAAMAERLRREHDVPSVVLGGDELARAEPGLRCRLAGAVHWTGTWACSDPGGLVERYAALFVSNGGRILRGDAASLAPDAGGWQVRTEEGAHDAADVVVALGASSPRLLKRFGYSFPMVLKRGYHQHFASSAAPRVPFMDTDHGTLLSPMRLGVRVLTGAELNQMDAPPASRQITRSVKRARELFALEAPVEAAPWFGTRPCMPNMLPVVGPARRHRGLWLNFGHGHQGFTLGPTTGALLAEQMAAPQH